MNSSTIQLLDLDPDFTDEKLEELFGDFGPIKRCFVIKPKKNQAKTRGIIQFGICDDVDKLFEDTKGQIKIDDEKSVHFKRIADEKQQNNTDKDLAQKEFDRQVAKQKKARLIVRNLPWKATDENMKGHFGKLGKVVDVNILKKKDGKMVGCAFVQYSNVAEAAKAIKELNGNNFLHRPIAIDWAVSKDRFQGQGSASVKEEPVDDTEVKTELIEDTEVKTEVKNPEEVKQNLLKIAGMPDKNDDDDDDLGSDAEDSDDDDDDNDEGDDDEDEEEEEKPKLLWTKGHDINENKTVFLRNLSFTSVEDDLRDMLQDNFGKVVFAKFVIDKVTEHPKGTAFVKFQKEDSANKCLEAISSDDGLWLDSRQIFGGMALRPDDAQTKMEAKRVQKEKKDSRNLYLSREGLVREGTQSAIGVSKKDLELRTLLEKRKKQMLKDLNRFISTTRLCIRNLPEKINQPTLKRLIMKNAPKDSKITECRVMKDMKTEKNKGFAFVEFSDHQMALGTLRSMNNNPDVFTKDQRPIVEFSIENKKVLNAKMKRLEKSREKNPTFNKDAVKGSKGSKENKKPKKSKPVATEEGGNESSDEETEREKFMGSQGKPGHTSMPTHSGPKIRHKRPAISRKDLKKREKDLKNPKKRKAINQAAPTTESSVSDEPAKKKAKKSKPKTKAEIKDIRDDKKFNQMVSAYKQKLQSSSGSSKKQKWFD